MLHVLDNLRNVAFAASIVLTSTSLQAQAGWIRQSPYPDTPQGQPSHAAFSATRGYIAGYGPDLLETTDGGWSWRKRSLGHNDFNAVTFFGPNHGWLVGDHSSLGGGAFRTTNGGTTWTVMANVPYGSYDKVQFVSPLRGWMGGNTVLATTGDGGVTWSLLNLPTPHFQARFAFRDENVGLISGDGSVYRTSDGGATWNVVATGWADSIQFLDANTAFVSWALLAPGQPEYARSTDAGLTWQAIDVPGIQLGRPTVASPTTLIAAETGYVRGDLYRSTDGGLTWSFSKEGFWYPYNGGGFLDAQNGVMLANGGMIQRTQDGGVTWTQVSNGLALYLLDIEMLDDARGVACGNDGTLLVTENGGTTWTPTRAGFEFSHGDVINSVSTVAPNFMFAAGSYGTLVKSLDGGRSWVGVPGPGAGYGDYDACSFVSENEGWIAGGFRAIYHTTDGGASWTQQYVVPGSGEGIYDIEFTDPLHGYAVGTFSGILRTSDGGAHWALNLVGSPYCRRIDMVDTNVGWMSSRESYIARTTDGGSTWTQQPIPIDPAHPEQFVLALGAIDANECWAATTHGAVYHTTNGGSTWVFDDTGAHTPYDSWLGLHAQADGDVWLAGFNGGILRRTGTTPESGTTYCFGDGSGAACPCGNASPAGARAGCLNSTGVGAQLEATGTARLVLDQVRLSVAGLPNSTVLFFQGTQTVADGAGAAFGDGLRCAGGSVVRIATKLVAGGGAEYPASGEFALAARGNVTSAGWRAYQAWYRNAASFCTASTSNLSNGVRILWRP